MSSRRHTVDQRFAEILEEDFGIDARTLIQALAGEPQKQAIAICGWAERADDPAGALLAWSRKHRRDVHRPGQRRDCRTESSADAAPRHRSNTDERRRGTPPSGSGSVGFGYGVGKETVLAGLARMGE